jgi:hypothetical protein
LSYNSSKSRKEYLVLTCGPPSISTSVPTGKGENGESSSDDESSGDEENQTVSFHNTLFLIPEFFYFRLCRDLYIIHDSLTFTPYFMGEEMPFGPYTIGFSRNLKKLYLSLLLLLLLFHTIQG